MKRLMTTLLYVLLGWTGLCFAQEDGETTGVTVSGKVSFTGPDGSTNEYGATGTVALLNSDGTTVKSAQVETTEDNIYPHYSIADVAAGTYTLSFLGEGYGDVIKFTEENFTVATTNIEKNITATVDNTVGYVTLTIKYGEWLDYGYGSGQWINTKFIPGATVTCTPKNSEPSLSGTSDESGEVKFLLAKQADLTYTFKVTASNYKDTTFDKVAFTMLPYGGLAPNNLIVYMREIPLPAVTVSGSVEKPTDIPAGLKLQLTTIKDKTLDAIDLAETYSFSGVPVGEGTTKIALHDPTNYSDYNRVYNYAITSPENGEFTVTGEDGGTVTQNLTIAKVAANVTGKVKDASSLNGSLTITLTKSGESSPACSTQIQYIQYTSEFTIPGVKPGTYTVGAKIDGYALKGTAPIVTVTEALEDVAIETELEFEPADMELTFSASSLYLSNSTTYETTYLDGAEIKLYDSTGGALGEPLATATADNYGSASLKITGKLGFKYFATVTHPAIKSASTTGTVTSSYTPLYFSNLEPSDTEEPDTKPLLGIKNLTYTLWTDTTLTLSWNWPTEWQTDDYAVRNIKLFRRLSSEASSGNVFLTSWDGSSLAYDAPCTLKDTVPEKDNLYTYAFEIYYNTPSGMFDTNFNIDLRKNHTLTYAANDAAWGTVEGDTASGSKLKKGDMFQLIAKAAADYRFKEWKDADQDTELGTRDIATFPMPARDFNVQAVFEQYIFTISVAADDAAHGEVAIDGDATKFELGENVTVKATPKAGYRFVSWKEGATEVSSRATYTFKAEKDRSLTAVFEEVNYVLGLGVNHTEWGKVEGAGEFKAGTSVEAKATANEGYKFVAWMEGETEVSTEATYTFNMPAKDLTLTAVFEDATTYYTVTLQANKAEWGKVEGTDKYAAGSNATIKATANQGYHFVAWMEGETEVSKEAVYTFKVEKDITLTAVFAEGAANEELEAARWTVYAENGTLVIKGLSGDRYAVYDLNGRLAGQAFCTGADIRMDVAPNKLYIVRRISAAGLFGAKKIVVR